MNSDRWIIGITGASGTIYARRLLQALLTHVSGIRLDVVVSTSALRVMRDEDGLAATGRLTPEMLLGFPSPAVSLVVDGANRPSVMLHNYHDIGASIASGSCPTRGMVVVPCSMKTLAAIAHGYGENLIGRAADVVLKERRRLILVPRETPLSAIHLKNMLTLARLGVAIVPAMPGFYHRPTAIADLVDMMVMRILDQMGYAIDLAPRWAAQTPTPELPAAVRDLPEKHSLGPLLPSGEGRGEGDREKSPQPDIESGDFRMRSEPQSKPGAARA